MDKDNNSYDSYLTNTSAFKSLNSISTSFNQGLSKSIMDFVQEKEDGITMSEIIAKFGDYGKVHSQVKRLLLDNKLQLYEMAPKSIQMEDFANQKLRMVDSSLSTWIDLAAQPCLTCSVAASCGISNPVSPVSCGEFNEWLEAELDME